MELKNFFKAVVISSVFGFCVSCSTNSNEADLKLIPVKAGDKWGFINKKGEYAINPQFAGADFFRDGLAKVISSEGKIGFVDEEGKYKITATYKDATSFSDGLAFVVSDGGYPTCIDKAGEVKFTLKEAKAIVAFSEGLAMFVNSSDKFGFVDKDGKIVINAQFDNASPFSEGMAAVKQKDKWGFINKEGKIEINTQFDGIRDFKNGKAMFRNGKQCGYIDKKGAYVINPQFEGAGDFSEGMAVIEQGKDQGYISEEGKIEINPQFNNALGFKSGLAAVEQNNKWGFIDKTGKIEINPQFDDASSFYSDIAFVKSSDKWGIIDRSGKYIVNPQFDFIRTDVEQFSYIRSDYYDATSFINKFFEKASNDSFDGFTTSSTLQNIVDNPLYGNIKANDKYSAFTYEKQRMTDEILISKTQFDFTTPIYENVNTYSRYFGYSYQTGTSKQYNFGEKVAVIEYEFDLTGNAQSKGSAIASALKAGIENKYKVKMESKPGQYTILQDGKMSFAIAYGDYACTFYVAFDKEKLMAELPEQKALTAEREWLEAKEKATQDSLALVAKADSIAAAAAAAYRN